jgi:hypothetical protein
MYDGEVPWDVLSLPRALTCSPDEDLIALALGQQDRGALEGTVARLERIRRAQGRALGNAREQLAAMPALERRVEAQDLAQREMQQHMEALKISVRDRTAEAETLRAQVEMLRTEADALRTEAQALRTEATDSRYWLAAMERSWSWRLTRPLRWLDERLRRRGRA